MNQETIRGIVDIVLATHACKDMNTINQSQSMRDELGFDSLDIVEVGLALEVEFEKRGKVFDAQKLDAAELDTVGSLYNAVTTQVNPGSNVVDT